MNYKKTFQFGKIASYGKIKSNLVEITAELKEEDGKYKFTASGSVWNHIHTDTIQGGQCIDSVYTDYKNQLHNRKLYEKIMSFWNKYYLNDMHADCTHQRQAKWSDILLDESKPKTQDNMAGWTYPEDNFIQSIGRKILDRLHGKSYKIARKLIKINVWATNRHKKGVMGKPCPVCGYKYGTSWVYEPIPENDLQEIIALLK